MLKISLRPRIASHGAYNMENQLGTKAKRSENIKKANSIAMKIMPVAACVSSDEKTNAVADERVKTRRNPP